HGAPTTATSGVGRAEMSRRTPPPSRGRDTPWAARGREQAGSGREIRAPARARGDMQSPDRGEELRLHGLNAVQAVFARRPQAIRTLYLAPDRIGVPQPTLTWCVANRLG